MTKYCPKISIKILLFLLLFKNACLMVLAFTTTTTTTINSKSTFITNNSNHHIIINKKPNAMLQSIFQSLRRQPPPLHHHYHQYSRQSSSTVLNAKSQKSTNANALMNENNNNNKNNIKSNDDDTAIATTTTTDEIPSDITGPFTLLLISQFLLFIGVGAVIPSIPLYGKELGFSSAANGIVISAPAVALLLLSKFGGNFADQARKPAMMIGMAIIALSDIGTACANGIGTLLIARLGLGAGRCISEAGERGMLADLANEIPSVRGRALAAQQAVTALGIAIGAPIGGIIVAQYGPRAAFVCVSVAACVALVLYNFLPETTTMSSMSSMTSTTTNTKEKIKSPKNPSLLANTKTKTTNETGTKSFLLGILEKTKTSTDNDTATTMAYAQKTNAAATPTTKTNAMLSLSISSNDNNDNNNNNNNIIINNNADWSMFLQQNQWRGLALCQMGASFGFAAKIACIPVLASDTLPGGPAGAGLLLSGAGLAGLIGAPIGGLLTDRYGSKTTVLTSGLLSALSLMAIPFALSSSTSSSLSTSAATATATATSTFSISIAGMELSGPALAFSIVVLIWSIGAAAQGPALTALAQQNAPKGAEATAMALPRAAGDGTYIVAPFILGLVTDITTTTSTTTSTTMSANHYNGSMNLMDTNNNTPLTQLSTMSHGPGIECAVAGVAGLVGILALSVLLEEKSTNIEK